MLRAYFVALLVLCTATTQIAFGQLNWPAANELAPINVNGVKACTFTPTGEVVALTATTIEVFASVSGGTPTILTISGASGTFRRVAATEGFYWICTSDAFYKVDKTTGAATALWGLGTDDVVADWNSNSVWVCRGAAGQIRNYLESNQWWDTQNTGDPRAVGMQQGSLRWVSGTNPAGISFDNFGFRLGTNVVSPTQGIQVRNAQGLPVGFLPNTQSTSTCNGSVSIYNSLAIATQPSTNEIRVWDEGTALPVTWVSFAVTATKTFVSLDWATASEKNNEGFAVERSADGVNYEEIGYVDGNGTTAATHNYQFVDHSPLQGIAYYRLKQEDWDGKFSHSVVRTTEFGVPSILVYPNPTSDWANVTNLREGDKVILVNAIGQIVQAVEAMNDTVTLQTAQLDAGVYFITINGRNTQRLRITH